MPRQPVAAWPCVGRCCQLWSPGARARLRHRARPHPKPRSAVIIVIEADRALLFGRVRLIYVKADLTSWGGGVLVGDKFLPLLDGVAFGRLDVHLAQSPDLLISNSGTAPGSVRQCPGQRCPRKLGPKRL